ncbi:MAG: hypothetical protein GY906_29205 [bacterium]|nr:hypothetical protein [bacterium]
MTMTIAMTMRMEVSACFEHQWLRMSALEQVFTTAIDFAIAIAIETLAPVNTMATGIGMAMGM